MSYLGADEVVQNYGIMGRFRRPAGALPLSSRRSSAPRHPRPCHFAGASRPAPPRHQVLDKLDGRGIERAPLTPLVFRDDVGALAAYLVSDVAETITGGTHLHRRGLQRRQRLILDGQSSSAIG